MAGDDLVIGEGSVPELPLVLQRGEIGGRVRAGGRAQDDRSTGLDGGGAQGTDACDGCPVRDRDVDPGDVGGAVVVHDGEDHRVIVLPGVGVEGVLSVPVLPVPEVPEEEEGGGIAGRVLGHGREGEILILLPVLVPAVDGCTVGSVIRDHDPDLQGVGGVLGIGDREIDDIASALVVGPAGRGGIQGVVGPVLKEPEEGQGFPGGGGAVEDDLLALVDEDEEVVGELRFGRGWYLILSGPGIEFNVICYVVSGTGGIQGRVVRAGNVAPPVISGVDNGTIVLCCIHTIILIVEDPIILDDIECGIRG